MAINNTDNYTNAYLRNNSYLRHGDQLIIEGAFRGGDLYAPRQNRFDPSKYNMSISLGSTEKTPFRVIIPNTVTDPAEIERLTKGAEEMFALAKPHKETGIPMLYLNRPTYWEDGVSPADAERLKKISGQDITPVQEERSKIKVAREVEEGTLETITSGSPNYKGEEPVQVYIYLSSGNEATDQDPAKSIRVNTVIFPKEAQFFQGGSGSGLEAFGYTYSEHPRTEEIAAAAKAVEESLTNGTEAIDTPFTEIDLDDSPF